MQFQVHIEYHTQWAEQVVLYMSGQRIPLHGAEQGLWMGTGELSDPVREVEYHYQIECEGRCVRREWRPHTLRLPEGVHNTELRIRDRWNDTPSDAPFYTSAFTRGIFARGEHPKTRTQIKGNITLRTTLPALRPDEVLAIAGSGSELGDWGRIIPLDDSRFPEWSLTLDTAGTFEYKFLIADRRTLAPLVWEQGDNRIWREVPDKDTLLIDASPIPRLPEYRWRGAGTAVPLFSLRSEEDFGVGEFRDLHSLIDWAAATGQRVIQLLPINDTTITGSWQDSYPYNANSTFALHPQYLHLPAAGVPADEDYLRLRKELNALPAVDYQRVNREKLRLLHAAYEQRGTQTIVRPDYRAFLDTNRHWLLPYAAFSALRDQHNTADFSRWGELALYDQRRVEEYARSREHQTGFYCWLQYHLHTQLSEVSAYARSRGVILKGDLPIGISRTSVDAWQFPGLFHMDSQAGAPPDAFSAVGQNWGFPTYDWERMAQEGYAWWKARLRKMAEYFDAYRIDHILGFFRIWEIPTHAVHGLLGSFNPALPYSADELRGMGFDTTAGRYTTPVPSEQMLTALFGEQRCEVRDKYIEHGRLRPEVATQRQVAEHFAGDHPPTVSLREGLMTLLDDVLFIEDPRSKGFFHPRIAAHSTYAYRSLDQAQRAAFDRLYDEFFYRRHTQFWKQTALRRLPALLAATGMLTCGEDLGMIPDSVPEVMHALQILSLEIQRMPKSAFETFANPAHYPYLSVCTTSTHDMNPLRAWWEEERSLTQRFYNEVLGMEGDAPTTCTPALCRRIVEEHLASPAMLTLLPLQDWLSTHERLRIPDPSQERINIPSDPHHYWRYRMPVTLEALLKTSDLNEALRKMIAGSDRC